MKKLRTQAAGPKTHGWEVMQLGRQPKLTGFRVLSHKHQARLLCPETQTNLDKKWSSYKYVWRTPALRTSYNYSSIPFIWNLVLVEMQISHRGSYVLRHVSHSVSQYKWLYLQEQEGEQREHKKSMKMDSPPPKGASCRIDQIWETWGPKISFAHSLSWPWRGPTPS